ncbi:MAG TPA: cytochrome c3 family protein [Kofleriaceae bacterium]|nr:cytochrome c3 family protein [Kofleriaceae bacterium]
MRAAIVVLMLGLAAATARADFDHYVHARDVDLESKPPIPCASCHAMKNGSLVGKPGHAACFGACHGPPPAKPKRGDKLVLAPERLRLCTSCHTEAALAAPTGATLPVTYPPYVATDFLLAAPHQTHRSASCTSCHVNAKLPPHRRCITCHDGVAAPGHGPPMTACEGCHTPGSGSPQPPKLAQPKNTVTSTFSHDKHAARGTTGAACITCHAPIRETNDSILPRPQASTCAVGGCHDGKPVFAITVACTRCHTKPPDGKYDVDRTTPRFTHLRTEHAQGACASCHPLTPAGEVLVAGHAPCAACHADDFGKRDPLICRACHNTTDPWRKLVADRLPREDTEFGASLPHAAHAGDCKRCHSLRTQTAQLRPPRGHRACLGSGCHAPTGGPAPQLTACEGCHTLELASRRMLARLGAPWSTRATFDHATHAVGKDGRELACKSCHEDLSAPDLLRLAAPKKAACATCHDGTTAFKLTGTTCTRCHPGAKR